jgi:hypothetical protein
MDDLETAEFELGAASGNFNAKLAPETIVDIARHAMRQRGIGGEFQPFRGRSRR